VLSYAAHDPILRQAALAVTHGGHGTAMRALRHGVPMVVMPGLAADQPYIAATVQDWKVGRALPGDADAAAIRDAAQDILSTPSYRINAQRMSAALAGVDGGSNAANEIEALIARRARHQGWGRDQRRGAAAASNENSAAARSIG
jgi:UDP:flavonoid glycosyltransferase YjiC (YdhE family)